MDEAEVDIGELLHDPFMADFVRMKRGWLTDWLVKKMGNRVEELQQNIGEIEDDPGVLEKSV